MPRWKKEIEKTSFPPFDSELRTLEGFSFKKQRRCKCLTVHLPLCIHRYVYMYIYIDDRCMYLVFFSVRGTCLSQQIPLKRKTCHRHHANRPHLDLSNHAPQLLLLIPFLHPWILSNGNQQSPKSHCCHIYHYESPVGRIHLHHPLGVENFGSS